MFFINADKSVLLGGNEEGRAWSNSLWTPLHCLSHSAEHVTAVPSVEVLVFCSSEQGSTVTISYKTRCIDPISGLNYQFGDPFFGHTAKTKEHRAGTSRGKFSLQLHGWSAARPGASPSVFHYGK